MFVGIDRLNVHFVVRPRAIDEITEDGDKDKYEGWLQQHFNQQITVSDKQKDQHQRIDRIIRVDQIPRQGGDNGMIGFMLI